MKKLTIYNKEFWMKKGYNEKESIEKVNVSKKETSCWNKEFWMKKGYNEKESIEKVKEKQSQNARKRNKQSYKNMKSPYELEYWLDREYNEKDSMNKIKDHKKKTNPYLVLSDEDINIMIENRRDTYYSKTDKERKDINSSRGIKMDELIKKYGYDKAKEITKNRGNRKLGVFMRFSKISKKFFDELQMKLPSVKMLYAENEKWIRKNKNKGVFVDLFIENGNKIIEFNGDFFHANPRLYNENSIIKISENKKLKAKNIWDNDKEKLDFLSEKYNVLVIWEKDVLDNMDKEINKCINFIKKN